MNAHWIIDLAVDRLVFPAAGEPLDRDAFVEVFWAEHGDALVGIDHGSVDVGEAAASGLIPSSRVIDAAAAPADRDWLGDAESQAMACWFTSESAAREAASWLAGITGCRVDGVRRHVAAATADWRDGFRALAIPGFGIVSPAWEEGHADATPAGVRMFIEPGVGFGTGLHETTQLCLQSLADWKADGGPMDRALDFGSGSGILGIATALLGALHVDAIDIDPTVLPAIQANAVRNGVGGRVRVSSSLPGMHEPCDVIVANIVAAVLLDHAHDLCARLQRGSRAALILSGLGVDDVPAVVEHYAAILHSTPVVTAAGGWQCLRFSLGYSRP